MAAVTEIKTKRNRGNNFTKEEELLLLSEVEKHRTIIECKTTDKVNTAEKNAAWRQIQTNFNSKNKSHRTVDQLKVKYDNLKTKTRKIVASDKKYIGGTGGGTPKPGDLDPVIEAVLRIIHKTSTIKLHNNYDSDIPINEAIEVEIDEIVAPTNILKESNKNTTSNEEVPKSNSWEILFHPNTELEGGEGSQQIELISEVGSEQTEMPKEVVVIATENEKTSEIPEKHEKPKQTWSKYTPKKLKTPMSHRLREVVNNPIKEAYYKKKKWS